MNEIEWIDVEIELPPCDGLYLIKTSSSMCALCYYDGDGFIFAGTYIVVNFWKPNISKQKKYGKVKENGI
jgi:hypothetical protein